jgi:hypothetical protein
MRATRWKKKAQIALELIEKVKAAGRNGIHLMAVGWKRSPRIVREAGLLPGLRARLR